MLADYLNNYPDRKKLNIMFIRDSEQIYKFGKKRVFIKIENGDHIRVRIGGGFMNIDNFMEQYAQVEFEKIERANML